MTRAEETLFDAENLQIFIFKHRETIEASGVDWKLFSEYFADVMNVGIFTKPDPLQEAKSLIIQDKKVVAYADVK